MIIMIMIMILIIVLMIMLIMIIALPTRAPPAATVRQSNPRDPFVD